MKTIPVFYRPEQVAESGGYSPSAAKPRQVVEDWQQAGLPIEIKRPCAVSPALLESVHSPEYVQGVLKCEIENGHGNTRKDVATSCLFTVGSMIDASMWAVRQGVACSPTSGFHHAHYNHGAGFCTFNGLVAAAFALLVRRAATDVAILDMDAHYPDGVYDCLRRLPLKYRERVHVRSLSEMYRPGPNANLRLFRDVRNFIRDVSRCQDPVLLYQAGADAHEDDPLNAGVLSTEAMQRRDEVVFRSCRRFGVPVVWNLAGGYQRDADGGISKVIALHRQTMQACVDTFVKAGSRPVSA